MCTSQAIDGAVIRVQSFLISLPWCLATGHCVPGWGQRNINLYKALGRKEQEVYQKARSTGQALQFQQASCLVLEGPRP